MIKSNLSKILGERRMRASALAAAAGINLNTTTALYHGRNRLISIDTLNKVCRALDCQVGDLYEYIPDQEEQPRPPLGRPPYKHQKAETAPAAPERPTEAAAAVIEEQPPAKRSRARKPAQAAQVKPAAEEAPVAEAKPKRTRKKAERQ